MIKFGPSGNAKSFYEQGYKSTVQAPDYLKKFNLDCFEYSFGRGVALSEQKAIEIGEAFASENIEISVHAPYFINFATPDDEKAQNSYKYVLDSAKFCRILGGKRIVFHPASQGKATRDEAVKKTKERLKRLADYVYLNGYEDMKFCPETMGKLAQIGTIEEIVDFCKIDAIYTPTVDFGHVNAREGGSLKTKDDYLSRLKYMIDELGYERMKNFHVHFSKIMYSAKGEIKHLTFEDTVYGPEFAPLALALMELDLQPYVICESDGTQAEDALTMKRIYNGISC